MVILMEMTPAHQSTETTRTLKELFWRQGYDRASIEDVVKATGMNRYALYNAFGGKRELFLAALDEYHQERKNVFVTTLNQPDAPPMDAIRRVVEFAISEMAERETGCLMCNVANEMSGKDPVIAERVGAYLAEIEMASCEALTRAEARGELATNITPQAAAKMVVTVILGLGVRAKAGASTEELLASFNAAMSTLTQECIQ